MVFGVLHTTVQHDLAINYQKRFLKCFYSNNLVQKKLGALFA